jgi:ATP synthase F1 delta subunit
MLASININNEFRTNIIQIFVFLYLVYMQSNSSIIFVFAMLMQMHILNQPIHTSNGQSAPVLSREPSTKSNNHPPASVSFNGKTDTTKQNHSSLACKASNVLHEEQSNAVQFQPYTLNFLQSMFQEEKLSPAYSLVLTVTVCSAVKLDQTQMDLIAKKMQRITGFSNLRLMNTVDPSLIAGFVISYGTDESSVIDLSVKGELAALANQ